MAVQGASVLLRLQCMLLGALPGFLPMVQLLYHAAGPRNALVIRRNVLPPGLFVAAQVWDIGSCGMAVLAAQLAAPILGAAAPFYTGGRAFVRAMRSAPEPTACPWGNTVRMVGAGYAGNGHFMLPGGRSRRAGHGLHCVGGVVPAGVGGTVCATAIWPGVRAAFAGGSRSDAVALPQAVDGTNIVDDSCTA